MTSIPCYNRTLAERIYNDTFHIYFAFRAILIVTVGINEYDESIEAMCIYGNEKLLKSGEQRTKGELEDATRHVSEEKDYSVAVVSYT